MLKKTFALVFGSILIISVTSCEKDSIFLPTDKKIEGKWKYEKVEFRKNFSFSKEDMSSGYSDLVIEFKSDNSIIQTSNISNHKVRGEWQMERICTHVDDDVNTTTESLVGYLVNNSNGEEVNYEWENLLVTREKISFTERRNNGIYKYKLRKK